MLQTTRPLSSPLVGSDDDNHTSYNDDDVLYLNLQFSLWQHPPPTNSTITTNNMLGVLRDFLCWSTSPSEFSVVSALDPSVNLCLTTTSASQKDDWENDLTVYAPIKATMMTFDGGSTNEWNDEDTKLAFGSVVTTLESSALLKWLKFQVTYQVVQLSPPYNPMQGVDTAHENSLAAGLLHPDLQSSVQQRLDRTIHKGELDEYLLEYFDTTARSKLSVVGDELETFMMPFGAAAMFAASEEYDFYDEAMVLRQIGTAFLVAIVWFVGVVTMLARHRRDNRLQLEQIDNESKLRRESKQQQQSHHAMEETDRAFVSTDVVYLETEQDVNHMLALGKAESVKAMQGSSIFLKSSSEEEDPSLLLITAEL